MRKINLDDSPTTPTSTELENNQNDIESAQIKNAVDETKVSDNNDNSMKSPLPKLTLILILVAILAGVGTGFGGYKLKSQSGSLLPKPSDIQQLAQEGQVNKGDVFGVKDEKTFKDSAQGYLEIGGIDGEGSHRILRPGGESQTVCLTSSITDLDKFEGMEIKIWGETFKGQKVGWLMDVGRVEIINPDAQAPSEE